MASLRKTTCFIFQEINIFQLFNKLCHFLCGFELTTFVKETEKRKVTEYTTKKAYQCKSYNEVACLKMSCCQWISTDFLLFSFFFYCELVLASGKIEKKNWKKLKKKKKHSSKWWWVIDCRKLSLLWKINHVVFLLINEARLLFWHLPFCYFMWPNLYNNNNYYNNVKMLARFLLSPIY